MNGAIPEGLGPLAFFNLIQTEWEDILGIIIGAGGFFLLSGVIAYFIYRLRLRTRELTNQERIALIEKSKEFPVNLDELLAAVTPSPEKDLRSGLFWLIIGIGITPVFYLIEDTRPYWPSGLIAVVIGLAYLANFALSKRREPAPHRPDMLVIQSTTVEALAEGPQPVALSVPDTAIEKDVYNA